MKCDTIPELKRFLSIQEQALGNLSPEVATTVSKLADLYLNQGFLDDAEKCYRRALDIRERLNGPHRAELEDSKRSLNKVLALKGDRLVRISAEMRAEQEIKKGQAAGNRDLEILLSTTGPFRRLDTDGQSTGPGGGTGPGAGAGNGAGANAGWGAGVGAGSNYSKLAARDQASTSFAPVDSSTSLDAVPSSMTLTPKPEVLTDAIKEACVEVALIRQVSGSDAPQLADALTRLADLYCRLKRYGDMEPILLEALSIREKRFGGNHHLVATSLKNLGRLYYFLYRFETAVPLFERSLSIRRTVFG